MVDTEAGHARAEVGKTLQVLRALGVEPYAIPVAPDHVRRAAASRD